MTKILLNNNYAYPWYMEKGIYFRGYFLINEKLYKGKDAIKYILSNLEEKNIEGILPKLNGSFSIIIENEDYIWLAVDRIRSLPLFYSLHEVDIYISEDANLIYKSLPQVSFNEVSLEEFNKTNLYVTGYNTLFNEINQVQAGELVIVKTENFDLSRVFYFTHAEGIISSKSESELKEEFKVIFDKACMNMKAVLNGRTAIVPLSGGTDSRELLLMLHSSGYKKVICFSYGEEGSKECNIAKELAEYFGYPWIKVDYTRERWKKLRSDKDYYEYLIFAGNFTSLPHIQDFLAVKELKERGILPNDGVFLPGHLGAIVGGVLIEDFLKEKEFNYNDVVRIMQLKAYGAKHKSKLSNALNEKIMSFFNPDKCNTNEECQAQCHCFSMKEKQAKYITNSVRVYEFFGYEWLLPLCDINFLAFMKELTMEFKHKKKFIREFMGLSAIKSTSDDSYYKSISRVVRKFPALLLIVRKFSKLPKYFTSQLRIEGLYDFSDYLKESFFADEHFTINNLTRKRYLSIVKEKRK